MVSDIAETPEQRPPPEEAVTDPPLVCPQIMHGFIKLLTSPMMRLPMMVEIGIIAKMARHANTNRRDVFKEKTSLCY
jgi:hypothetical protein